MRLLAIEIGEIYNTVREISEVITTILGLQNIKSPYEHINSLYHNFILLKCCSSKF